MAVKQNTDNNDAPQQTTAQNDVSGQAQAVATPGGNGKNNMPLNPNALNPKKSPLSDAGGGEGSVPLAAGLNADNNMLKEPIKMSMPDSNIPNNKTKMSGIPTNCNKQSLHGKNGLAGTRDISHILHLIEIVETKEMQCKISYQEMLKVYHHLIVQLSCVVVPINEIQRFKEDIMKVGQFLEKSNDRRVYLFYLRTVCQMITTPSLIPSPAIAIIFQLFDAEMILEAIQSLLEHNLPENDIRRTAMLLCEWLRTTYFCQNLNIWVMAILAGLQEQQKYELYNKICLDNIEQLFASLVLPILRPKVAPIVFHMLSTVQHTPVVFHKVLPRFPRVLQFIKQQSKSLDANGDDMKIIQQMVDLTSALMVRFYDYDDLYAPIEEALKDFRPSYNYLNYAKIQNTNDTISSSGDDLLNSSNAKVGLINLGNTCYMNSVLQALAMTKEFCREILLLKTTAPLLIKMQQQIALMLYSLRHELIPTSVLNATRPPGFTQGVQQDSSEFLGYLLETLHEQESAYAKKCISSTTTLTSQATSTAQLDYNEADDLLSEQSDTANTSATTLITEAAATAGTASASALATNSAADTACSGTFLNPPTAAGPASMTTIDKTFTGKLATTYKCLTCGWESRNTDCFRDLQLSFPEIKNDCSASNYSVQDLIDYYCSPEKLYGENQYFCERCKKLSDAERYINVINAPKNLILTLKHFKYDQKYHTRAKLMHKVFHDEKVSVKVCAPNSMQEIACVHYDLYAGVVHSGYSMDSGHYYTYAADASNQWYKFNDNIVTPSNSEELHNLSPPNTPYILFYQMSARTVEQTESNVEAGANEEASETSSSASSSSVASSSLTVGNQRIIPVSIPQQLNMDELPNGLREYIIHDNRTYTEEMRLRNYQLANAAKLREQQQQQQQSHNIITRRDNYDNDDDDENHPPTGGCGGNSLNMNMNRFVY